MRSRILADTGPLVSLLNRRDHHHEIHEASLVFTLDSDFKIYRKNGRTALPLLLPDDR